MKVPVHFALSLLVWLAPPAALAADYIRDEKPAPESADELGGPLDEAFEERLPRPIPRLRQRLKDLAPFFRDSELDLELRSYWFDRSNADGSRNDTWALGGSLAYRSGRWKELLSVGAEVFTSQKLHGPRDRDGAGLLRPRQTGLTVLGQAYLDLHHSDLLQARLYRQDLNLPYLNRQDSRMIPNTFEAYLVRGLGSRVQYVAGHVTRMKKRDSRHFVPISNAAGASGDRGLTLAGARFTPREGVSIGAIDYYAWDVMNIFYAEAEFSRQLRGEWGLRLSGQFTHQRSVGDELLDTPAFSTHVWGARAALSYQKAILRLAVSQTGDDAAIRSPFGGYPGYVSLMREDFDRAGEKAWVVGLSYHFGRFGWPGLSAYANFARGTDARDPVAGGSLPNQEEFDLTVDYRPTEGPLENLWLRLRWATLDVRSDAGSAHDFRIILKYEIPVL